ncbi:hypothetical protein AB1L30_07435 [Bremerella sp. JC817]|uniref:hypothetical protein n=1 Tax=Bremerella sp. JC817 TaxID=3231756 RepID=UPI00345970D2
MQNTARQIYLGMLVLLLLPMIGCGGCSQEKQIVLVISGTETSEQRKAIQENTSAWLDGSQSYFTLGYESGGVYTLKISPVEDVQAAAEKIDFGTVTKIEDRTIYVEYHPPADAEE